MTTCPRCAAPLEGLAQYCHECSEYVSDMTATVEDLQLPSSPKRDPDRRSEEEISLAIRAVLELHGFDVYSLEQGYRKDRGGTRQTPGIADLYVLGHGRAIWIELKSAKGKLRPSQEEFRDQCQANGVEWALWRSEADAIEWARDVREAAA